MTNNSVRLALVDGVRSLPSAGAKGECPTCGSAMIAKCGPKVIHHWAHKGRLECDPWWEGMTQWHLDWQANWPLECREINHKAPDGEIHRCDVKTQSGIYVEIQHSAMTDAERQSREDFYQNMVWIIDGTKFAKKFTIHHILPDPSLEWAKNLDWYPVEHPSHRGTSRGMYVKRALVGEDRETHDYSKMGLIFFLSKNQKMFEEAYIGHHQYSWLRPHSTWLAATRPVYIDFGDDFVCRLERYPIGKIPCVRLLSKTEFIAELSSREFATDVCI
ncbi:competence protein CoiA [Xanthomonas translucens]|uniref:competence protein CoiA n=2 Tax=Xanthomonas campestris pv. translucens TaxID=343 RepID=UPI0013E8EEEF|nr:competence protein CoiA family protein [Xanthomonas translucens]UKE57726.1 hypothetical protein KFS86_17230 [Xanthomonas translucens pv. hordei]